MRFHADTGYPFDTDNRAYRGLLTVSGEHLRPSPGPATTATTPFAYTVGLTAHHPELLIAGLPPEVAHGAARRTVQQA